MLYKIHTHPVFVALLPTLGRRITAERIKYLQDSLSQSLQAKAIFHNAYCIFFAHAAMFKVHLLFNKRQLHPFLNIAGFDTFLMLIF